MHIEQVRTFLARRPDMKAQGVVHVRLRLRHPLIDGIVIETLE